MNLRRYNEADQVAHGIYTSALKIDIPGGALVQEAMRVVANSYGQLKQLAREEELSRQIV